MTGKSYFASDFHLGIPKDTTRDRERKIVKWLEQKAADASHFYLLGDVFDFWFEYKTVVPRGYTRLLGCMASISDSGIGITMFKGNHDMWMFGYLTEEMGVRIVSNELVEEINGKKFFMHHGDGLGPGDSGYKFIKKVFRNPVCQKLFGALHPSVGIGLANYFSGKSRIANGDADKKFLGEENEWLLIYCKELLQKAHYDYMIFGHRHLPLDIAIGDRSRYINLGDWVKDFTYAAFDGNELKLLDLNGDPAGRR